MFVDSHVNLHSDKYADDLADVVARARAAGVKAMLTISDQLSSTDAIAAIAAADPLIWRSIGVHPHHAKDYADLTAQTLIDLAADDDVVGIGECGLDFYYEYSDRAVQEAVFRAHIAASQTTGLPLSMGKGSSPPCFTATPAGRRSPKRRWRSAAMCRFQALSRSKTPAISALSRRRRRWTGSSLKRIARIWRRRRCAGGATSRPMSSMLLKNLRKSKASALRT